MTTTRRILAGTIDVSVVLRIIDSTDGTPETGVVFNTSGIDLEYRRELAASVDITEATLAALTTAHADGGFLHIGNGYYRLDLPDAACAAGVTGVLVHGIVTGMVVIGTYIELVAYNPYDAVRLGLTALPNAAAEAAGGLFTRGTGAGQINQAANGQVDTNAVALSGDSVAADNAESFFDGTGYGEILQRTTIATLATQVSFTLTAGSADNNAYNGCVIVIQDAATAAQKAVAVISAYTGATKTVALLSDPAVFTMATTDIVTIIANRSLKSTVDNRTLDVSAGGEAGVDWANIGSPTTAQNLSATNIDVDQIVASVSGAVGSVTGAVGSVASGGITAASLAADAITAAKIADGAIDAATFAAGAINAAAIATDAITAAKIAADAIGASELAADAVTEIQSGLATAAALDAVDNFIDTEIAAIITTLGTPSNLGSGATVAANLADIEGQTDDIGAAGAGLTAIPWNATWDAEVQSEVDDALIAQNLDHLVKIAVDTDFATTVHLNSVVGHLADNGTAATFDRTTDSLEALQGVSAPSAATIADAVWDETLAGHLGAGSTGEALNAAGGAGDPWVTALPGAYGAGSAGKIIGDNVNATISSRASQASLDTLDDFVDTEVAAIKAKTDNLPADPADASDIAASFTTVNGKLDVIDDFLDTEIAAIKAKTDNIPAVPANEATLTTIAGYIDAEITDIQARLPAALVGGRMDSNMQAAGNGVITAAVVATDAIDSDAIAANAITEIQNGLATAAALTVIDDFLDTEITTLQADVSAILLDTGTDGVVVAVASKTGYTLSAAGVDEIFDELRAGHNVSGSYGESFFSLESGAAIAGTLSTTQMSTNLTEVTNDHYNGRVIIWLSGALLRQGTDITAYNGTTKVLTYTATTEAPAASDRFVIV